jgi:hypothetical protein
MQVEKIVKALYAKRTTIQPKNLSIFTRAANPCAEILARVSLSAERPCFGVSRKSAKRADRLVKRLPIGPVAGSTLLKPGE